MNLALYSCTGKERFDSFSQANAVAKRATRRSSLKPDVYHCTHCGGFHIGNKKKKPLSKKIEARRQA